MIRRGNIIAVIVLMFMAIINVNSEEPMISDANIYTYTLEPAGTAAFYDESLAVACIQGIINRESPQVYVLSTGNVRPQYLKKRDGSQVRNLWRCRIWMRWLHLQATG